MKILVVDDEPYFLLLIKKVLTLAGHDVISAENGEQAWELFNQASASFHLVITDVSMPELGGLELLARIQKAGHNFPAVIMTGHLESELSAEQIELGIIKILCKPFKLKELQSFITMVRTNLDVNDAVVSEFLVVRIIFYEDRVQI